MTRHLSTKEELAVSDTHTHTHTHTQKHRQGPDECLPSKAVQASVS